MVAGECKEGMLDGQEAACAAERHLPAEAKGCDAAGEVDKHVRDERDDLARGGTCVSHAVVRAPTRAQTHLYYCAEERADV